jgi:RNA polymerase sigma-70 factor (ECF subfamily)
MSYAEISTYRPVLHSVAYKMLGCTSTAEDMVQDTFLNWFKVDQKKVVNVKAYLVRSVTNACFNYLESFKQKKEDFFENINPSISLPKLYTDLGSIDFKNEITTAISQVFKKLPPAERAVFVLKGLFDFEYSDLTEVLGKKTENCRQLYSRAQQKLSDEKVRFNIDADRIFKFAEEFKKATLGEFSGMIESLKNDISSENEK